MNWNRSIRQFHRLVSVAFVAAFIIVVIAMSAGEEPAEWVYLLPLLPLFLLSTTGIYLFVLPYSARWRGGARRAE